MTRTIGLSLPGITCLFSVVAAGSNLGRPCTVRRGEKLIRFDTQKGRTYRLDGALHQRPRVPPRGVRPDKTPVRHRETQGNTFSRARR